MASLAFLLVYTMVRSPSTRQANQGQAGLLVVAIILNLALFAFLFVQTVIDGEVLTWASVIGLLVISFGIEYAWRRHNHEILDWLGH